jgi:ribosomal protein S18 acetylase RimI-like enzyme
VTVVPVPAEPCAWLVTSGTPAPDVVERLLRALPQWFGIESSTSEYIRMAGELPAYVAWGPGRPPPGQGRAAAGQAGAGQGRAAAGQAGAGQGPTQRPAGALLAVRHFPRAAEIYLLAVDPAQHRRGAGRAMVTALERDLIADGVRFLQVKTLGPSHPDAGYRRTRKFYLAMGFEPVEEITGLWPPGNPCLIMMKSLGG